MYTLNYVDRLIGLNINDLHILLDENIHNIKITLTPDTEYSVITVILDNKTLLTSKNLVDKCAGGHTIFYFTEKYIFACSCMQRFNKDKTVSLNLKYYIDLNKKDIYFSNLKQLHKYKESLTSIQETITNLKEDFFNYLNNTDKPNFYFFYNMTRHIGHDLLDNWTGLDPIENIVQNKVLINTCNFHKPSNVLSLIHLKELFYNDTCITKGNLECNKHIILKNILLLCARSESYTFNFLKKIKSIDLLNVDNKDQVVLAVKYNEYRRPVNQLEFLIQTINCFYKHGKKKFLIFTRFGEQENFCIKNEEMHISLIADLKKHFVEKPEIIIIELLSYNFNHIIKNVYNSFAYISPYGTLQHILSFLTNCDLNICHGDKCFGVKPFKLLSIPDYTIKEKVYFPAPQGRTDDKYKDCCYILDILEVQKWYDANLVKHINL